MLGKFLGMGGKKRESVPQTNVPRSDRFWTSLAFRSTGGTHLRVAESMPPQDLPEVLAAIYATADPEVPIHGALSALAGFVGGETAAVADRCLARGVVRPEGSRVRCGTDAGIVFMEVPLGPDSSLWLHIVRGAELGLFDDSDARRLDLLVEHFGRATSLRNNTLRARSGLGILDHLAIPAFIVDRRLHILSSNSRAKEILNAGQILFVSGGQVRCRVLEGEADLRRAAEQVAGSETGTSLVPLPEQDGSPAMFARVMQASAAGSGAILVLLSMSGDDAIDGGLLQAAYALSPAEARLAGMLIEGWSPSDVARILGVTMNTVRTQLKNVFRKTGTRRQSELVSALLRGPLRFL